MLVHSINFDCTKLRQLTFWWPKRAMKRLKPANVEMLYLSNVCFFQFLSVLVFVQCYYLRVDQPVNPE